MKYWQALGGCVVLTVALNARAAGVTIAIEKFAFAPRELTVAPGTTVVWNNRDETPHTISAKDGSFVSKAMDTDDHFEHTFASAGDFTYFCTLHPFMTGVVHVRADADAHAASGQDK
jgi:plastocyanin